ncbi:MAG: Rpn family recombination-promoting nuclease/putative transposase [Spirochaetales bacterium]
MPYSPLTHDSVFLHVFGEPEGIPLLESLVNAHFEAVGLPLVHKLQLQPRDLPPTHDGEKLAILDILAQDETGRTVNVEVQTTRKPAYFERALFYWARLFARQLPKGEDYTTLKPVISLNFLEYEISRKGPWLHHFRLPQTAHLGFIFVELPKLLRSPGSRALLKKAAIWGRFLEKPETSPANGPADLVALLGAAKQRMEAYLMLEPEVYREIHESMEHHDYVSVRGEGYREAKAEVATALLARGMSVAEVAELTGLPLAEVTKLNDQRATHKRG